MFEKCRDGIFRLFYDSGRDDLQQLSAASARTLFAEELQYQQPGHQHHPSELRDSFGRPLCSKLALGAAGSRHRHLPC
jgi:hypothetical protein